MALNDVQFKELIVGKPSTSATRSLVTNRLRGPAPNHRMDAKTPDPAVMGHLKFDPETHYEIGDGHVITYIGGAPFEIKSISSATDYVACRGDEYGYANYEVEAEGH